MNYSLLVEAISAIGFVKKRALACLVEHVPVTMQETIPSISPLRRSVDQSV
jgi:hypothetical protein